MPRRPRFLPHRSIRRLWLASAGTSVAVWSAQLAVTIHVLRGHSVAVLAIVGLAGSLPSLLLLPVAGICADRYDVRRLSISALAAQAVCFALLATVMQRGLVALTVLYAFQGALSAFWPPARQQWLYGLVAPELRQEANSAIGSISGVMTLVGATFGGLLSAWQPAAAVCAAAALQLVAVAQLVVVPRSRTVTAARDGAARRPLGDLVDALRAARDLPLARSIVWIGIAWGLIGGGYNVLLAGHMTRDLHGGAITLGLVYAADGLSVIVAATFAARLSQRRQLAVYASAYVVQGVAWALTFAANSVALAVSALVVMRLASGYIIALDTTILLETVPARLRGRIVSLHMTTYNAVARISLAAVGATLTALTISTIGIAAGVTSAGFGVVWWWRSGRPARTLYGEDRLARSAPPRSRDRRRMGWPPLREYRVRRTPAVRVRRFRIRASSRSTRRHPGRGAS
jgi:predicted MFS family arabinose efflux permease